MLSGNFAEMTTSTPFRDLLHAANLRHGTDGFTSPPNEGVLRIFFALKNPTASAGFKPANLGTKGLVIQYFSQLSDKRHDFRKKVIVHKMYVMIFSTTLYETFLILRTTERYIIINVHRSSCKVPVIFIRF